MPNPFDQLGFVLKHENGQLSEEEYREGLQTMVDDGTIWALPTHYGREASAMIAAGFLNPRRW
jgi:hypothetical protein